MGKLLGFLFFVAGLAAVYIWGIRPLTANTDAGGRAIVLTTRGQPTPRILNDDQRGASTVASRFLARWQARDYNGMYDLLTAAAQARIARQSFVARYGRVMAEATVQSLSAAPGAVQISMPEATVAFSDTMKTRALDVIAQQNRMNLIYERGHWGIDWYPALIFKQLEDPYVVRLQTVAARRGSILDRTGAPFAEDGQYITLGVVPGQISDESRLLNYLSGWLHMPQAQLHHLYTLSWAQPDFFMPIATITQEQFKAAPVGIQGVLNDGVTYEQKDGRVYPQNSVAAILIGYVNPETHRGVAGLERSLDSVLTGTPGARLVVTNQPGTIVAATIAERRMISGKDVRLTIDLPTQRAAERFLGLRNGAAVALDPANGAVLALASTPGYDPNGFEVSASSTHGIGPVRSTFPRATLGTYPTGSIFKIVTMAAALEHGGYSATSPIDGPAVWYGLGAGTPLHDWSAVGHGTISLQEALTQSCDTCFYQVAKKLDGIDPNLLPREARAFGFGAPTGIDAVSETTGLVGDNSYKQKTYHDAWRTGDSVNLSIGQGYFLATPLQTAAMLAAVAAGGARHAPHLILSIGRDRWRTPTASGKLPVSADHLRQIARGMVGVTTENSGTATFVFRGFPWPVAGKTGTAQNPGAKPHAWFGAFAPADHPRIALVVVVENGGEGSMVAAPIARDILTVYLSEVAALRHGASGPQQLTAPSH